MLSSCSHHSPVPRALTVDAHRLFSSRVHVQARRSVNPFIQFNGRAKKAVFSSSFVLPLLGIGIHPQVRVRHPTSFRLDRRHRNTLSPGAHAPSSHTIRAAPSPLSFKFLSSALFPFMTTMTTRDHQPSHSTLPLTLSYVSIESFRHKERRRLIYGFLVLGF